MLLRFIIYGTWRPGSAHLLPGKQLLKQLKHPSHDLLITIWHDQNCVQGRGLGERQGQKGCQHPGILPCHGRNPSLRFVSSYELGIFYFEINNNIIVLI